CAAIPEPPRKGGHKGGRKPVLLRDALFTAVFKVYSTFSARRFMSDPREAVERGHMTENYSMNVAWTTLQSSRITPILHELIRRSSLACQLRLPTRGLLGIGPGESEREVAMEFHWFLAGILFYSAIRYESQFPPEPFLPRIVRPASLWPLYPVGVWP